MNRREFLEGATGLGAALVMPRFEALRAGQMPADVTEMTASTLSTAIRERRVTCREVMRAYLDRIHRYNPVYNAIVNLVDDDELMRRAAAADEELDRGEYRGWMHGMPHAVKDLANAAGLPTTSGSPLYADRVPSEDDVPIARIRQAGAIFIGKTNVPEFGMGSQTYNTVFGATGSAYDPALTAGGSSGGAACGLATHMLPVADGSDMMGSLRNPGAFNNVIGLRPTQGRVPEGGADLFYQQLSVSGPMGRNAEDAFRLLCTMAGAHPAIPGSLRDDVGPPDPFQPAEVRGLRIGWLGTYGGYLEAEAGIAELCEAGLRALSDAGARVESCRPEYDMERLWETWLTLRHWSRNGMRPLYDDPAARRMLKPEAVWEIEGCLDMPADRVYAAGIARADWYRALGRLFESYDVLALPTSQVFPFPKDVHWPAKINDREMDTYHRWMEGLIGGTLGGLPVANVPVGFDDRGRPMGMQLLAPFGDDRRVLEIALAYDGLTGYLSRAPRLVEGA